MKLKYFLFLLTTLAPLVNTIAAKVDTVNVFSSAMGKNIPVVIVLPSAYEKSTTALPVLYLLHGLGDKHSMWIKTVPSIKNLADQYGLIIVCPDGGRNSWYLDSPLDKTSQYETFIASELLTYLESNYKVVKNKSGRCITGLSMGGQGALYLASRHPDKYACAGGMSGAYDLTFQNLEEVHSVRLLKEVAEKLGEDPHSWQENSVVNMVEKLKAAKIPLIIDCGTDDFLIKDSRKLHQLLLDNHTAHDYIERPGSHNWDYWTNAIEYQVLFFNKVLKKQGR